MKKNGENERYFKKIARIYREGANIVIYANQLMRSAYQAMVRQTQFILDNKRTDESICEPVKKILNAIDGKDLKV